MICFFIVLERWLANMYTLQYGALSIENNKYLNCYQCYMTYLLANQEMSFLKLSSDVNNVCV